MSQENVEGVRRGLEAYNRLDPDAFLEGATEDVEWFPAMGVAIGDGAFRGREGVERFMDEIRESWLEVEVIIEELRDLDDRVLVLGRQRGRARGSGVDIDAPFGAVVDIRDGKMSCARSFFDQDAALKAAGLAE
jgi:ketosteroid isomerase-like protein